MKKVMNHSEYQKRVNKMTVEQLMFVIKDAKEAADANPDGENVGYYLDEVCYAGMELHRRRNS